MPRVVIELQANTQDAVNKIQQFAKAQRDAFDAIRAGNPALADATVKVSALKDAYTRDGGRAELRPQGPPAAASIKTITTALTDAGGRRGLWHGDRRAEGRDLEVLRRPRGRREKSSAAMGAFRTVTKDLIGDIPIVGGLLAKLSTQFGAFPLLIGGGRRGRRRPPQDAGRTGARRPTATADRMTALSRGDRAHLQQSVLDDEGDPRRRRPGEAASGLAIGAEKASSRPAEARAGRRASRRPKQGTREDPDLWSEASWDHQLGAEARRSEATPSGRSRGGGRRTRAQDRRDRGAAEGRSRRSSRRTTTRNSRGTSEKRLKGAAEAAEKQAQLLEDAGGRRVSRSSRGSATGFKGVTDALTLAQFVKDSTAALDTLKQAFDNGIIPLDAFTQGTQALQEKMAEAIKLGYVPMTGGGRRPRAAAFEDSARAANFGAARMRDGAAAMQSPRRWRPRRRPTRASPSRGLGRGWPGARRGRGRAVARRPRSSSAVRATLPSAQGVLNAYASANRPGPRRRWTRPLVVRHVPARRHRAGLGPRADHRPRGRADPAGGRAQSARGAARSSASNPARSRSRAR